MKADKILKKKWRVGFDDGSGQARRDAGAYILTDDKNESIYPENCDYVVIGGDNNLGAVGVVHQKVAEHIVKLHNESLEKKE